MYVNLFLLSFFSDQTDGSDLLVCQPTIFEAYRLGLTRTCTQMTYHEKHDINKPNLSRTVLVRPLFFTEDVAASDDDGTDSLSPSRENTDDV